MPATDRDEHHDTGTLLEGAAARPVDEDGWRLLVEWAVDVIAVIDADGVCLLINPAVERVLGYRPDELVGTNLVDLVHPDDVPGALVELADVVGGAYGGLPSMFRARHRNGSWRWVEVLGRPLPAGAVSGAVIISVRDAQPIRHQQEFEAVLDRLAARFLDTGVDLDDAVCAGLGDLGAFIDADWVLLYAADPATRVATCSHQWRRPGCRPGAELGPDRPFDDLPATYARLEKLEAVHIPDVAGLGADWASDRAVYEKFGLGTVTSLPFGESDLLTGHVCFLTVGRTAADWSGDTLGMLRAAVPVFCQVLARTRAEREVAGRRAELAEAFDAAPVALTLADPEGRLVRVNRAYCELFGVRPADLEGHPFIDTVHPDDVERNLAMQDALVHTGQPYEIEKRMHLAGGEWRWVRVRVAPANGPNGEPGYTTAYVDDITAHKEVASNLAKSEARYRTLVDNLPDPVIRVSAAGRRVFANPAALALTGMSADEARDLRSEDLGYPPETAAMWRARVRAVLRTGQGEVLEYPLPTARGRRWFHTQLVPELGPDGTVESVLAVSRDLTDLKASEAELAHQALHDPLTGLPNRKLFMAHLEQALLRLQRHHGIVAVLFFDLDRFKVVNDSLGHASGDELLVEVSRRLRAAFRPEDTVARLGGDEFTVLLEDMRDPTEAVHAAERVQGALAGPIEVGGAEVFTSASIGLALADTAELSPTELLRHADAAMYRAKDRGRNRCEVFDDALAATVTERLAMESGLRLALDRDELEVWYQPEVDLHTLRVVAVEALLRWHHPAKGLLTAGSFVTLAEETGLIVPIGRWVLNQALHQLATWNSGRADPLVMRINLSAHQLSEPGLVRTVAGALATHAVDPALVCFEITETALMRDREAGLVALRGLEGLGCQLALDDFGTGYSSLAYLKRFPLDVLKIDRSFVDGLPDDGEDVAIVTTIILLAETLGMKCTAEGIETPQQVATLRALGCSTGQGYWFAAPGPPSDIERFVVPAAGSGQPRA